MKFALILFGIVAVFLSGFYIISSDNFQPLQFNQVFAQSENKNFEDAETIQSSETSTDAKSKETKSQRALDEDILSQFNGTFTIMGNKNKDKTFPNGIPSTSESSKIHPTIINIFEHANPNAMAKIYGEKMDNNKLFVYIHLEEKEDKQPLDVEILSQYKNIIKSKLTLSQIQSLANLESVEKISLPNYAVFYGHGQSEGIEFSGADDLHNIGFNGTGIKVAILDDSFNTTNPEIVDNVQNANSTSCATMLCDKTDGDSHGTAVAEIVVDMAPGVSLWLYSIVDDVDFFNAVDHAIANDVDIITASFGFPTISGDTWYRDGTSGPAQKVNEANSTGILFTVATGNDGDKHWKGLYVPKNSTDLEGNFKDDMTMPSPNGPHPVAYESVMVFNSSAAGNLQACLPVNANFGIFDIIWNAWPTTNDDYDVLLYDTNMTAFTNWASQAFQNGNSSSTPVESLFGGVGGDACLVLASDHSTQNHTFHIYHDKFNALNIPTNDTSRLGSVDTPADASGALSVGAVNFNNSTTNYSDDFLESFSSKGPTDDGRLKPEICGPDGTFTHQTTLVEGTQFFGTSAATPHVAGAAALLLQINPNQPVEQLKQKLIDNARSDEDFSKDNFCGSSSGSLSLLCSPPDSGDWVVSSDCILSASDVAPGNVTVQDNAILIIPTGLTLDIDFANFDLILKSGGSILIKSGGELS